MHAEDGVSRQPVDYAPRRSPRVRTFLDAKIVFRDATYSVGCIVRDMSEAGARIELPVSVLIPKRFFLLTPKKPVAFDAEIVWRLDCLVGLKIQSELQLTNCRDPQMRILRKIFVELLPGAQS